MMLKKLIVLVLLLAILVPMGSATAQNTHPDTCDFEAAFDAVLLRLENLQTLDDAAELVDFLAVLVVDCSQTWLNELLDAVFGVPPPTVEEAFDPDDGVLTEGEAEYALDAVFSGDIETANQYLCPEDQVLPEDVELLPPDMETTIEGCTANEDRMYCDISFTMDGIDGASVPAEFEVVDGKLCADDFAGE